MKGGNVNPLLAQVVRHTEANRDQSLAATLMEGTWARGVSIYLRNIYIY